MTDTRSEARQRHVLHLRSKASVMAREEAKAKALKINVKPPTVTSTVKVTAAKPKAK